MYGLGYNLLNCKARLVELVDTSDLKSDSILEYRFNSGNEYYPPSEK